MDDLAGSPPSDNPFDQIQPDAPAPAPAATGGDSAPNPFDAVGPDVAPQTSATGAFARGFERGVIPAAGGLAGAAAGAEAGAPIGAALGAPFGGVGAAPGAVIGGLVGGVAGAFGGGWLAGKVQDTALRAAPDTWKDALGQDERQQQLDQSFHPTASFLGGIAPYALTMKPGFAAAGKLPENATSFQRLIAHPATKALFGGATMGGVELAQEAAQGQVDWRNVGIATGMGVFFHGPNRLGEAIEAPARGGVRAALGDRAYTPPTVATADAAPADEAPPTVAQAGDHKVMGPGITEDVFQGAHEQDPAAEMAAQDNARNEHVMIGEPSPGPDVNAIARQMHPETFDRYDELSKQRDAFRAAIEAQRNPPQEDFDALTAKRTDLEAQLAARGSYQGGPEARRLRAQIRDVQNQADALTARRDSFAQGQGVDTPEMAQARKHLQDVDYQMRDMGREVAAAYRRAADAIRSDTVPAPAARAPEAGPTDTPMFSSMAEMLAARGDVPGAPQNPAQPQVPAAAPQTPAPNAEALSAPASAPEAAPLSEPMIPAVAPGRTPEQQREFIVRDATQRLVAAGRPFDEAQAAARLLAARYETRAARFDGKLGTAEQVYARESAAIAGPGGKAVAPAPSPGEPTLAPAPRQSEATPARAASKPRVMSLLEFLAGSGGLKDTKEVRAALGGENPFLPGFGRLIRKEGGLTEDAALRAASEYLHDPGAAQGAGPRQLDVNDLRDAIGQEAGGSKIYRPNDQPPVPKRDVAAEKDAVHRNVYRDMEDAGIDPSKVDASLMDRTVDMIYRGEQTDPLAAYERAVMEQSDQFEAAHGQRVADTGEIPGWDVPADTGATPEAGGAASRDEEGTAAQERDGARDAGGAARDAGAGDREAAERELAQEADPFAGMGDAEFMQDARGKIRISEGRRPIISLMKDANASTFIHETGHQWLEEMMRDGDHPEAPDVLKDDAQTIRDWLGVDSREDIKTRQHEKFARGFEQYMREGVAPSPGLAGVFSKFKGWLTTLYQTLRGLGKPISEDIRGVFDRMLAMEPERTVVAPEQSGGPSLADVHETDAVETEPHEAEPAMDRVIAERDRSIQEQPPEIQRELEASIAKAQAEAAANGSGSEPAGQADASAGGQPEVVGGGGGPEPVSAGGGGGAQPGAVKRGGSEARPEGNGLSGSEQRRGADADPGSAQLAPRPATLFGPEESPFLDRAGNIRLDTLTTREDVAQVIKDAADANNDFIGDRRGVITDGQVMDLAQDLGMSAASLNTRKIGQAFNAEQVMAARTLLRQSATEVSAAAKRASTGTDEDVMAYGLAKDRHQMIQAQVAGITAEAGRALRAFRNIAGDETQGIDQFIRQATGKTLFQLKAEAKLASAMDTPQAVSKFMQDATKPSFGRMLLEYWINGLISGPVTHTTYMMGNTVLTANKMFLEAPAAALSNHLRSQFGREGDGARLSEVAGQLQGMRSGFAPALNAMLDAYKTGRTTLLPGEEGAATLPFAPNDFSKPAVLDEAVKMRDVVGNTFSTIRGMRDGIVAAGALLKAGGIEGAPLIGAEPSASGAIPDLSVRGVPVLPVGTIARLPSRNVAAIHSFFRSMNYSIDKAGAAYRVAANEGLEGNTFDARVADIRSNPSEAVMEGSRASATDLTLMGQGGEFVKALSKMTNVEFNIPGLGLTQPLKFIDPFVHIAANVVDQSIVQRTPVGILSPEIRADLLGKNGNAAQDAASAKMLVGTALAVTFGGLASQGLISGSGPSDPKEAAMWRQAGNQPHSIRIGNFWYDAHRLGPLGMLLGVSADMQEVAHDALSGDMLTAGAHLQHAFTQNIMDESFMKGPADLLKAVEDPGRYGEGYIKQFGSSFVPYSVGMFQMARAADPYSRETRTVMDAIKAKVPWLSQSLQPRVDIWGQPVANRNALLGKAVTAIYETPVGTDPVDQAMLNLGIYPAPVERKIRNVDLTDQQHFEFATLAGRMAKSRLDTIVRSPDFRMWPNNIQHDVMKESIDQAREAARGIMMARYPSIPVAATQARINPVKKR